MKSLEHWNEIGSVSNGASFPHLESLSIICCWKLVNIPNLFQGSPKLRSLKIIQCEELTKLPNWLDLCSSLEDMSLCDCPNVNNSLPNLENMPSLSSLSIVNFKNLPEGLACICNLKRLKVHGELQGLDWSPFMHLNSSLENLELVDMGVSSLLLQLPRQLEHLMALKSLQIVGTNGVESLPEWLGNLTSLETLNLYRCQNLKSFPSKEATSNLTRLNHLLVSGCSRLQLGEGSLEWEKVSHVPDVNIQDETTNMFLSVSV